MQEHVESYKRGKQFYTNKKYREALREFSRIDLKSVGNFDESIVHHYSGLCYAHLMDLDKSIECFNLAIKYRPNYGKIYLDMGLTYFFFYEKNIVVDSALRVMGKKNRLQKALECFEAGILVEPSNADLWYYRGYMLELLGRKKEALESFEKSVEFFEGMENYEGSGLFNDVKGKKVA